jgi:hypothetical protein
MAEEKKETYIVKQIALVHDSRRYHSGDKIVLPESEYKALVKEGAKLEVLNGK